MYIYTLHYTYTAIFHTSYCCCKPSTKHQVHWVRPSQDGTPRKPRITEEEPVTTVSKREGEQINAKGIVATTREDAT